MGYAGRDNSHYCSFDTLDKNIVRLKPKGEMMSQFSYVGVGGVEDYGTFFSTLKSAVQSDPNDRQLSDVTGLQGLPMKFIETKEWMDIGNVDGLMQARKQISDSFDILDKDDESIFFTGDSVIKFFHNERICSDRIARAQILSGLIPNLIGKGNNFYQYKYKEGDVLSRNCSGGKFLKLLDWLKENLWKGSSVSIKSECQSFYVDKTKKRIESFLFTSGMLDKPIEINGRMVDSATTLLAKIDWERFTNVNGYKIHGDLILDNIIDGPDGFCLIDWRQDFGGNIQLGDIYYDLGKLNHNLVFNHDIVSAGRFSVGGDPMMIDINRSHRLLECQEVLMGWLEDNGFDPWKVKVMSCIIWLNMAPLHQYPLDRFLYFFGRSELQKALNGK
jgi:hypothetical protein